MKKAVAVLSALIATLLAEPLGTTRRTTHTDKNPKLSPVFSRHFLDGHINANFVAEKDKQKSDVLQRGPVDLTYAGGGAPCGSAINNAVAVGLNNTVAFDPALSCVSTLLADPAHQLTSLLVSATTREDAHSEEQTLAVHTSIGTGFKKAYKHGERYQIGDNYSVSGYDYRVIKEGTTSNETTSYPTSRPLTYPYTIIDGSVIALEINDASVDGKIGAYFEENVNEGAGATWGFASNVELRKGLKMSSHNGAEMDFSNNASVCAIGVSNCNNLVLSEHGLFTNTTDLYIDGGSTDVPGAIWGERITGFWSQSAIEIATVSQYGLSFNAYGSQTKHYGSAVFDNSLGDFGYLNVSPKSRAAFADQSDASASLMSKGRHAAGDIILDTTSADAIVVQGPHKHGLRMIGSYSKSAISTPGFEVDGLGNIILTTAKVKPTATAALPICNGAIEGTFAGVNDAISVHYNEQLIGGGSAHIAAYCNGSKWVSH